jgi:hypothetical protein
MGSAYYTNTKIIVAPALMHHLDACIADYKVFRA